MERVYAARSHTSARSAFLCDFYRSRSPSRVLNTILNTISLASNFTPQETRGPLAMMPVEAMSAAAARCTYRSKSSREGVDRGAWRVALLLASCLLVSSFGVAESSCVANVEPSTYDLRVGEVEVDRLHRQDVGLDLGGVIEQNQFGRSIALHGDTMVAIAALRINDDENSQDKVSNRYEYGIRLYVRKVPGDKTSGWREHWQSPFLDSFREADEIAVHGDTFVVTKTANWPTRIMTFTRKVPGDVNSEWESTSFHDNGVPNIHSVSIHEHTLVVGYDVDNDSNNGNNQVAVFRRASLQGVWEPSAVPLARPSDLGGPFQPMRSWAEHVRVHGDTVVVSERLYSVDGTSSLKYDRGRVCIYSYNTGAWVLDPPECVQPDWTLLEQSMPDAYQGHPHFGYSIDIDGDTIVAGGFGTCSNRGAAWVFQRRKDSAAGYKWVQTSTLFAADTASDTIGDRFGISVAIDGGTIAVSSESDKSEDSTYDQPPGAIYIFTVDVAGSWIPRGKIWPHSTLYQRRTWGSGTSPTSPYSQSNYANKIAMRDGTLVVAASNYKPDATGSDTGALFVYSLPGTNEFEKNFAAEEIAALPETSNERFDFDPLPASKGQLGYPVRIDMDEDFLVIAGRHEGKDKVFVYARDNRTLIAELLPSDATQGNDWIGFGASVAISNGIVVVSHIEGKNYFDCGGRIGAVYVYKISSSTTGIKTEDQKLLPGPDPCAYYAINANYAHHNNGPFGTSVAIDGDTIVVGAPRASIDYDGDGVMNNTNVGYLHGTVHIYTRDNSTWTWRRELRASEMQQVEPSWDSNVIHLDGEQDQWSPAFGYSVGVSGHTIVVSSYGENAEIDYANDAIGGDVGSAYVFTRSSSDPPNWAPRAWLTVRDEHPSNLMGSSCAIDGDTIAVGAQNQDTDSHGAVHVFYRDVPGDPNSGWTQVEKLRGEHDLPHGQANDVQLKLGASVDIYGDVIIAGGVMGNVGSAGAAYIFTRDRPGVSSSTWTQRDRIFTGVANDHLGARGVVVHGDLAMIAGGGNPDDGSPASFVRVYRLPCPERDITDPNTCSCDDLMAINGFKIADEFSSSSSPSSGCYGPAPTYKYTEPSPPAPLPSFRFAVDAPSKTGYGYFGDCLCLCKGEQVANGTIDVTDDQGGVGFSFSKCVDEGPEECGDMATEGYIDACDVNFTTTWSYVPTYTGACNPGYEGTNCQTASACTNSSIPTKDGSDGSIHCGEHGIVGGTTGSCTCTCNPGWDGSGCETASACTNSSISTKDGSDGSIHCGEHGNVGGTTGSCTCTCEDGWEGSGCETVADAPAPSPDPGSGGGTSDELGDCSCYCDADKTDFAGNVTGCDGNGGDCGVTSAECSSLGPDDRCPSTFGQTCSTYYVEWFVNPSYSSGHSHNDSGSGETRKNCECLCDDQSWSTRVFPNLDTCSQGECGITESACSDSSAGSVYDTCTSYNQDAVDNGDSDACTGTVSTRWTYDGYSYSQGPTSSPDPGSG